MPYGTLLCVSDKPLHGEIKLPGQANAFYERAISQHLRIGIETLRILRREGAAAPFAQAAQLRRAAVPLSDAPEVRGFPPIFRRDVQHSAQRSTEFFMRRGAEFLNGKIVGLL